MPRSTSLLRAAVMAAAAARHMATAFRAPPIIQAVGRAGVAAARRNLHSGRPAAGQGASLGTGDRGRPSAVAADGARRGITAVILGPPGGGKGTISKRLIRDFGFEHLSTGDMLREQVRLGSALGEAAQEHMKAGRLVPDDLIVDIVLKTLEASQKEHILLDGFPRTVPQADVLKDKGLPISLALNLDVPHEEIVRRTSGRWVHPGSGRTYAYDFNPPKREGLDDVTGEPLVQREDDAPEAVRARLRVHDESSSPLVHYYQDLGVLARFDGSDQPELVAADRRSDAIYASLHPYVAKTLGATREEE